MSWLLCYDGLAALLTHLPNLSHPSYCSETISYVSKLHLRTSTMRRTFFDSQIFWLSWRSLSGNKNAHVMCSGLIPLFLHRSCCIQHYNICQKNSILFREGKPWNLLTNTTEYLENIAKKKKNSWWQTSQIWLLTKCESSDLCTESSVHHISAKYVSNSEITC